MLELSSVHALTADKNPYQAIVDRNIFGLKPPPPPPPPPEPPKPNAPKITLTGIVTFNGKRALMKAILPGKPGEPGKPGQPQEESFTLGEGQSQDQIEVLEIDPKAGTVKVNNFGTEMVLNFTDNGVKTPPTAAPAPGAVPQPFPRPAGIPAPGANAATPYGGGFNTGIPPRIPRTGAPAGAQGQPTSGSGFQPSSPGGFQPATGQPGSLGGFPAAATPQATDGGTPVAGPSAASLEQSVLLYEAKRLSRGDKWPHPPPHPLAAGLSDAPAQSPAQQAPLPQ